MVLTVQVLTRNNIDTIERCLESAFATGGRVVVGDLGSDDGTDELCEARGADVRRLDFGGDYSQLRNSLLAPGRNMYLEPWESMSAGAGRVASMDGSFAFYVVQGGVVSKQVRLWSEGTFKNPVFEHVDARGDVVVAPEVVLSSDGAPDLRESNTAICRGWVARRPASPEPWYYLACSLLAEGKMDEFVGSAVKYLSMDRSPGDSSVLMNYYLARVEALKGRFDVASKRALGCLALHPSFSEFWCLLGDLMYSRGGYEKAMSLYGNALAAGRRRRSDDLLPIEVAKYGSYPRRMAERCALALKGGLLVGGKGPEIHR